MIEVPLPSLGADMDQGTLLEWRVKAGDVVQKGDPIAVVDTTKAALDVESWHAGTVHQLLLEPGQTVSVGTPMLRLLEPGEAAPAEGPAAVTEAAPVAAAQPAVAPRAAPTPALATTTARQPVSPAARRRAAELGVRLDVLHGTGPNGAVTLADVETAAARPAAPAEDRTAAIRRAVATAMSRSKREIPHYYLTEDVPLGNAVDWLRRANLERPITERLLPAALFVRAVALAALKHPAMNGFYVDGEFRPSAAVNVGVAISLRGGGVIAPAIHAVEQKSLVEVMRALTDLVARARAGRLRRDELAEPTITLTNLGDNSVTAVHAVIYAPQVAMVGAGAIRERAWVVAGTVVPMAAVTLTLAADHRVSDGHAGAKFLAEVAAQLQRPESL
jgi:pyruvate dehydrogenase E2 component (dihydrolipoamide acetyltransferase)